MKRRGAVRVLAGVGLAVALLQAREAGAADSPVTCVYVEPEFVGVDGLIDEWKGVRYAVFGKGSSDASFALRCAYDDERLYLAINARDDKVIRTRVAKVGSEDHLTLSLRGTGAPLHVTVLPGTPTGPPKTLSEPRRVRGLEVADSLQPRGYSVELAVPRSAIAGVGSKTPAIEAKIALHDTDRATAHRIATVVEFDAFLELESGRRAFKAFLDTVKLRPRDIRLDRLADLDTVPGAERLVWGGRILGVLTDQFSFMELPVSKPSDVLGVEVVDFDGDGRSFVLLHLRQHGGGGSRDVVLLWEAKPGGAFQTLAGFEVAKQLGSARILGTYRLVPRGAVRKLRRGERARGVDLLVLRGEATGTSASQWSEAPAPDVDPILLPWGETEAVVYAFDGNAVEKLEPDARKLRAYRAKSR